jgi:hypothetical protein
MDKVSKYLFDIQSAISLIKSFTKDIHSSLLNVFPYDRADMAVVVKNMKNIRSFGQRAAQRRHIVSFCLHRFQQ